MSGVYRLIRNKNTDQFQASRLNAFICLPLGPAPTESDIIIHLSLTEVVAAPSESDIIIHLFLTEVVAACLGGAHLEIKDKNKIGMHGFFTIIIITVIICGRI